MKINMPLLKLIMRLLILLIMFVMLFLISAFLYSARYWKDVYAYITPNITIKRIPTVSELNITENEFTTEIYYTTTNLYDYDGISTTEALEISYEFENENDTVEEDLMSFHVVEKRGSDDFEVQSMDVYEHEGVLYDEFKRSTAEPQDMPAFGPYIGYVKQKSDADVMYDIAVYDPQSTKDTLTTDSCVTRSRSRDVTGVLFPWVAAIFVRDVSSSRYTYVCDGAVLSQYTVLTGE
ncbi:hypothetical protein JYU34_020687 [Plutella xylostella]|uniref:Uncharacterized protein n=1 Tax=Plutella xylostella TaxID=51655 RepID=A0ABQ7PYM1_PLUXY|nr:hypothetical protein JYU34_020687 [Plutella xylostella]